MSTLSTNLITPLDKSFLDLSQDAAGIVLPAGTNGQRPAAAPGVLRFNTTVGYLEVAISPTNWQSLPPALNQTVNLLQPEPIGLSNPNTATFTELLTELVEVSNLLTVEGELKLGTSSSVGEVWTAIDTMGNGAWLPLPDPVTINPNLNPTATLQVTDPTWTTLTLSYSIEEASRAAIFRGNTELWVLGAGTFSGLYVDTALPHSTTFSYEIRETVGSNAGVLATASGTTSVAPPGSDGLPALPAAWIGRLSIVSSTENSITIAYDYQNAPDPIAIYRTTLPASGSVNVHSLPAGSSSGTFTDTNLTPATSYRYNLRNPTAIPANVEISNRAHGTTKVPESLAVGDLSVSPHSQNVVFVTVVFSNGTTMRLFQNGTQVHQVNSSSVMNSFTVGVNSGQLYVFSLYDSTYKLVHRIHYRHA